MHCIKFFGLVLLTGWGYLPLAAQSYPPVEVVNSNPVPGKHISRTMHLLENNRKDPARAVRIMIYGQSITRMEWWLVVREYLIQKYAGTQLDIRNYAIGGFQAERLVRCVERDLLDFYPDLIIFHDYGGEETYEEIIRMFRKLTTAEVMILNDHIGIGQDQAWHDRHSWEWLPELCKKYNLELVDVRTSWIRYARQYGYDDEDFLRDHVHMNPLGNYLMAEIVKAHLIYDPALEPDPLNGVTRIELTPSPGERTDRQVIHTAVNGNRIELIFSGNMQDIQDLIRIDSRPVTEYPAAIIPSRVYLNPYGSYPEKIGIPVKIRLSDQAEEDHWKMVIGKVEDDGFKIPFDLYSDREGFQGSGDNLSSFCSLNGVVCFWPEDWFYRKEPGYFSPWKSVIQGDTLLFELRELNELRYDPYAGTSTRSITGLSPGDHELQLEWKPDLMKGKKLILICYDPPLFRSDQ